MMTNNYVNVMSSGDRTCYFNIEMAKSGKPFLKINIVGGTNSKDQQCIRIFESEIEAFGSGLMRTLVNYPFAENKMSPPRAFEKWSLEEDAILEVNFATGMSMSELMTTLGRAESAIQKRIDKLRLEEKYIV